MLHTVPKLCYGINKTSWLSVFEACGARRKHRNLGTDKVSEILINLLSCCNKRN